MKTWFMVVVMAGAMAGCTTTPVEHGQAVEVPKERVMKSLVEGDDAWASFAFAEDSTHSKAFWRNIADASQGQCIG